MKLFGINLFGTRQSATASSGSDLSSTGSAPSLLKNPVDTVSHAHIETEQNIPDKSKTKITSPDNSTNQGASTSDSSAGENTPSAPNSFTDIPVSSSPHPSSASPLSPGIRAASLPPLSPSLKTPSTLSGTNGLSIYTAVNGNKNSGLGSLGGMIGGALGGMAVGAGVGVAGAAGSVLGAAIGSAGLGAGLKGLNFDFKSETLTLEERLAKKEEEAKEQIKQMIDSLEGSQTDGEQKIVESKTHVSIGGVILKKQN